MKTTALPPKRSVKTLLLILILSMAGMANAHPVDMNLAREVGAKFINANTRMNVTSGENLQLVTTYNTSHGDAAFHVFNTPQGFVIVSADNCATPILGYSDEGRPFKASWNRLSTASKTKLKLTKPRRSNGNW